MIDLPEGPWLANWETKHIRPSTVKTVLQELAFRPKARFALTFCFDEHYGRGPHHIISDFQTHGQWPMDMTDLQKKIYYHEARSILRTLRVLGLVEFGCLQDEDQGYLQGRGYWLSTFGKAILMEMRDQNIDPWDKIIS